MFVTVFALAVLAWLYARGTRAVWRVAGRGRGVRSWQTVAFGAGLATLMVALVSPLDGMSEQLFSAHMVQHLLLVAIAAPLIALGGPLLPLAWAWPRAARLGHGWARRGQMLASLPVAFGVHSLALWLWHTPVLYEGALRDDLLHATEHLALLGTGLLFWSTAGAGLTRGGRGLGASVLYVFGIGAQCTGLGALIALANRPWYPLYGERSVAWGLSAMDDQVLAGAIMWVPAGLVYLAFALVLLGAWLRPLPRSAEQH